MTHTRIVLFALFGMLGSAGCDASGQAPPDTGAGFRAATKGELGGDADLTTNQLVEFAGGIAVYDPTDLVVRGKDGVNVLITSADGPKGEACTIDVGSFLDLLAHAGSGTEPPLERPKWVSMKKSEDPDGQVRCSGGCGGGTVSECCRVNIGNAE